MTEQKNDIAELNTYLKQISFEVDSMNEDNFNDKLTIVNNYIRCLDNKKVELKKKSTKNDYYYICDLLHNRVKLISDKFDSIIEKKKEEQLSISSELSKIVVKKKLINYQR